jgi:hypothetical protein
MRKYLAAFLLLVRHRQRIKGYQTSAIEPAFNAAMNETLPIHAIVLIVLLLASTIAAAAASGPARDTRTMCPSIYQPVCGQKGSESRTFANACLAKGAGFAVVRGGGCGAASSGLPRFCTKEYAPVCGERNGERRDFGNACEARAEDYAVLHDGTC